jgi:adenosylhomocysteine nucleosidase
MKYPLEPASIDTSKALFVFALPSEAAGEFDRCSCLFTGVGKVNAAYHLTKQIAKHKPGLIINLGSAGSNIFQRGTIVCCTQFIQRDMDATGLGFKSFETPFSGEPALLEYGHFIERLPTGICGSGDHFETAHTNTGYHVVDMEAYALAFIAKKEQVPFLCLKYISDGADGGAADDWSTEVHKAASAFKKIICF